MRSASRSAAARRGAEHRAEREEAARREIDPAHGALWRRVGRGIKGSPEQRAARFNEYVEENPREAIAALDDYADREVARMVAAQTRADRAAALAEIDAWYDLDDARERPELAPIPARRSKLTPRVTSDTMGSVARKKRKRRARRTRKHSPKKVVHMARRRRRRSSALAVRRHSAPKHRARSGGSKAVGKNLLVIVGAPAALALAENAGIAIPTIGAAGEAGTLGLIGYALNYFGIVRSPLLRDASIGLLGVAAYDAVRKSGFGSKGVHGDVDGSYDAGYHGQ
jgi:hypothetical protein